MTQSVVCLYSVKCRNIITSKIFTVVFCLNICVNSDHGSLPGGGFESKVELTNNNYGRNDLSENLELDKYTVNNSDTIAEETVIKNKDHFVELNILDSVFFNTFKIDKIIVNYANQSRKKVHTLAICASCQSSGPGRSWRR